MVHAVVALDPGLEEVAGFGGGVETFGDAGCGHLLAEGGFVDYEGVGEVISEGLACGGLVYFYEGEGVCAKGDVQEAGEVSCYCLEGVGGGAGCGDYAEAEEGEAGGVAVG